MICLTFRQKCCPWPSATFLSSGPTNNMLPSYQVNNCITFYMELSPEDTNDITLFLKNWMLFSKTKFNFYKVNSDKSCTTLLSLPRELLFWMLSKISLKLNSLYIVIYIYISISIYV